MSEFEKIITPFRKDTYEPKSKDASSRYDAEKYEELNIERKEEKDFYAGIRTELREMKKSGVDFHFSQIDPDKLSNEALDFFRKYKRNDLKEEEVDKFTSKFVPGDNEYNFMALVRTWLLEKKGIAVGKEKEMLKNEALKKITELKKKKPCIAAYLDSIDLAALRRLDYKIVEDLNPENFGDYESNLREYFSNKIKGKNNADLVETKLTIIENDSRFKYYCALREALDLGPCNPETFIQG